jgi:hypothetical protein
MLDFAKDADDIYRASAKQLDQAFELVAHKDMMSYATLEELAERLLPAELASKNKKFPASGLYAVHRTLVRSDVGFRCSNLGTHRVGGKFEISSLAEVKTINGVTSLVRSYQEFVTRPPKNRTSLPFAVSVVKSFIEKAQKVLDISRKTRQPTECGTIGSYQSATGNRPDNFSDEKHVTWTPHDEWILNFMESWSVLRTIHLNSAINSTGSTILKLVGRYDSFVLDSSTGWLFLQELGAIAPWENRVQYDARFPETGRRLRKLRQFPVSTQMQLTPADDDHMSEYRHDWGSLPVYCIDAAGAHEIDDGVSLEKVPGSADQYWIHIHVADPASRIEPQNRLGRIARDLVESCYLPERVRSMLPPMLVQNHLSLAEDRSTLTFSAKLDLDGNMLEHKITPGTIHKVKYTTPEVVDKALGQPSDDISNRVKLHVGPELPSESVRKGLLEVSQLTEDDVQSLKIINHIGKNRHARQVQRGSVSIGFPRPNVSIQFPTPDEQRYRPEHAFCSVSHHFNYDPTILFNAQRFDPNVNPPETGAIVRNAMAVASEVAAKWCAERNLPIIYRVTPKHPDRPDPAEYFQEILSPSIRANGRPPLNIGLEYLRLLGSVQPSTVPGPHLAMGMDKYTRCTSPLRRFTDLLLHWQVEAAIRKEAELGRSIVGTEWCERDDWLPFSRADVEAMLPDIASKERSIANTSADGMSTWTIQLLIRAWHGKEAKLPETFQFFVRSVVEQADEALEQRVSGILTDFGINAEFTVPPWMDAADIKLGDVFETKIYSLDSYYRRVKMEVVRKIRSVGVDGYMV